MKNHTTREVVACLAEYITRASTLPDKDKGKEGKELYRKANELAICLAVYLPADTYKKLGEAMHTADRDLLIEVIEDVRNQYQYPDELAMVQDIIQHHPEGPGFHDGLGELP